MMGGVSGHAGLFGSAHDVAALFQMLLQEGSYGGRQYLSPEIIHEFTSRYPGDLRRGLGFDMKQLESNRSVNMSKLASSETFGHLGFTGTAVWADPKEDMVFVFLSNRTYPDMENKRLSRLGTRIEAQTAAYQAIIRDSERTRRETPVSRGDATAKLGKIP
jgi:CubicO group peptidase (beta-lactamase class C family)